MLRAMVSAQQIRTNTEAKNRLADLLEAARWAVAVNWSISRSVGHKPVEPIPY